MKASEFKEKCLSLFEHLEEEGLIITKHGKPIAQVIPFRENSKNLFGILKGKIQVKGDILSTGVQWNAAES